MTLVSMMANQLNGNAGHKWRPMTQRDIDDLVGGRREQDLERPPARFATNKLGVYRIDLQYQKMQMDVVFVDTASIQYTANMASIEHVL